MYLLPCLFILANAAVLSLGQRKTSITIKVGDLTPLASQPANGQEQFNYATQEGKEAAAFLLWFRTNLKASFADYAKELKSGGNKENVDTTVDDCVKSTQVDDYAVLDNSVTESLKKIQKFDNDYRVSNLVCFSLRLPETQSCKDAKQKAMDGIENVISPVELQKLIVLYADALYAFKTELDLCLEDC